MLCNNSLPYHRNTILVPRWRLDAAMASASGTGWLFNCCTMLQGGKMSGCLQSFTSWSVPLTIGLQIMLSQQHTSRHALISNTVGSWPLNHTRPLAVVSTKNLEWFQGPAGAQTAHAHGDYTSQPAASVHTVRTLTQTNHQDSQQCKHAIHSEVLCLRW
jgi:hypothetical protein